ncbi:MAG: Polysaccharide biosynthesis protein [Pseudomonadota bacterium]|jgi:O-antigen/teichoic acid export membrane protein
MANSLKTFIAHAGTSYLLLSSRFFGVFALRILADPVTVGIINSAQIIAPIYSALTSGPIYNALRAVPTQNKSEQSNTTWTYIVANMLEGAVLLMPFLLVYSWLQKETESLNILTLAIMALYIASERFFGVVESMFMALSRGAQVVKFRLLHICELGAGLLLVGSLGTDGFLVVTPVFALFTLALALRNLPLLHWNWGRVKRALTLTRYGASIGAEKLLSAIAGSLDGLIVAFVLGPASLGGYYLGVSVRGAFGTVINSIYWTFWPKAVREQDNSGKNIFSDLSASVRIGVLALAFSLLAMFIIDWIVEFYLVSYKGELLIIQVLIAGVVPFAFSEWDRARLVVEGRTEWLPVMTLIKSIIFLAIVGFGSNVFELSPLLISLAVFASQSAHMVMLTGKAFSEAAPPFLLKVLLTRSFLAISSFGYFNL